MATTTSQGLKNSALVCAIFELMGNFVRTGVVPLTLSMVHVFFFFYEDENSLATSPVWATFVLVCRQMLNVDGKENSGVCKSIAAVKTGLLHEMRSCLLISAKCCNRNL